MRAKQHTRSGQDAREVVSPVDTMNKPVEGGEQLTLVVVFDKVSRMLPQRTEHAGHRLTNRRDLTEREA